MLTLTLIIIGAVLWALLALVWLLAVWLLWR